MITDITTEAEFDEALAKPGLSVFKFTAPSWCRPCQALKPHYEAAAEKIDANFYDIDIDVAETSLVQRFEILHVPTVLAFREGQPTREVLDRNVQGLIKSLMEL